MINDSVAQLVEQQTLNLWVQGSIPCWVTFLLEKKRFWRGGRVVDYSGLENRRTAMYRGFESLPLRK